LVDHAADATSATFFHVIFEAKSAFASRKIVGGDGVATGAQGIEFADEVEHGARRGQVSIGAEIARAVAHHVARHKHARIVFVGHHNPGVGFVVLEQHVVARFELLDHGVFKVERILLGGHHHVGHISNSAHQHVGARRGMMSVEV